MSIFLRGFINKNQLKSFSSIYKYLKDNYSQAISKIALRLTVSFLNLAFTEQSRHIVALYVLNTFPVIAQLFHMGYSE